MPNNHLIQVIGAAFHYQNDDDPQARELQETVRQQGLPAAVEKYTGLSADSREGKAVLAAIDSQATAGN